jgi:hypothetical protein
LNRFIRSSRNLGSPILYRFSLYLSAGRSIAGRLLIRRQSNVFFVPNFASVSETLIPLSDSSSHWLRLIVSLDSDQRNRTDQTRSAFLFSPCFLQRCVSNRQSCYACCFSFFSFPCFSCSLFFLA